MDEREVHNTAPMKKVDLVIFAGVTLYALFVVAVVAFLVIAEWMVND